MTEVHSAEAQAGLNSYPVPFMPGFTRFLKNQLYQEKGCDLKRHHSPPPTPPTPYQFVFRVGEGVKYLLEPLNSSSEKPVLTTQTLSHVDVRRGSLKCLKGPHVLKR